MSTDPPALGKGMFGYRKSAVNQIIADRDIMLRQAEGRVRAAESRVAELEHDVIAVRERNNRMEEQLERLRLQLDQLVAPGDVVPQTGTDTAFDAPPEHEPEAVTAQPSPSESPASETGAWESQTPDAEALRDDAHFSYVAAWQFTGVGKPPKLHREPLDFHYVHPTQRSYK